VYGQQRGFLRRYDYFAQAGIVHYANHHISPGKKQWTWGNHEFGYAWGSQSDRRRCRGEFGPYIEIMAGVYTDNQPDFSFLQPGETKSWSQYWYPIQKIGPAQHANLTAAISSRAFDGRLKLGVAVTSSQPGTVITVTSKEKTVDRFKRDLSPARPFVETLKLPSGVVETDLLIQVSDQSGRELISYKPKTRARSQVPPPASEPAAPADIASADELYVTGLHLDQYRHATRSPTSYWCEALRRDPLDSRCNNAMGLWHLRRGEFNEAQSHFVKP